MDKSAEEMNISTAIDSENTSTSSWELLGLRAYKAPNDTTTSYNIMQQVPSVKIKIADFDDSTRAHMIYSYADTVPNNPSRSVDDKIEING
jgi:hypothetical protein